MAEFFSAFVVRLTKKDVFMQAVRKKSFGRRILKAGFWTVGGQILNQTLRFAGNLVMTRLLFPEAFGLMAIVQTVIVGITLLTDVGIGPVVVQHRRGNDEDFLNTAWTLQIVRSILVWIATCFLTPILSSFYNQPLLNQILPIVSLTIVIGGFDSTKLHTANRNLDAARATLQEVGTNALGLILTILFAIAEPSVWALVWGNLIAALLRAFSSHWAFPGVGNRFRWEKSSVNQIVSFSRWILLSSAVTFLSGEGMRLMIAAFLDLRQLAFYSLASAIGLMALQLVQQVSGKVLFPAYSEIHRESPDKLQHLVFRARVIMIMPCWILSLVFVLWGSEIIQILYDPRYHESGIMLKYIALGMLVGSVSSSYSGILMSKGMVAINTALQIAQVSCQVAGAWIGHFYFGEAGAIFGLAMSNWLLYPITAFTMARIQLWQYKLDFPFIGASTVVLVLFWPA